MLGRGLTIHLLAQPILSQLVRKDDRHTADFYKYCVERGSKVTRPRCASFWLSQFVSRCEIFLSCQSQSHGAGGWSVLLLAPVIYFITTFLLYHNVVHCDRYAHFAVKVSFLLCLWRHPDQPMSCFTVADLSHCEYFILSTEVPLHCSKPECKTIVVIICH